MQEKITEHLVPTPEEDLVDELTPTPTQPRWSRAWEVLIRYGLGETTLRIGTGVASIILFLLVIWVMGRYYLDNTNISAPDTVMASSLQGDGSQPASIPADYTYTGSPYEGITRQVDSHTVHRAKVRVEVDQYVVKKGDTLFAIAERFNLKPQTILWANYNVMADDPHRLKPGQKLNILPIDGVYYEWHASDGLNGVAKYFGVTVEDIISYPTNQLTAESVGDPAAPNIKAGTWLVIPGGHREFVTWSAPLITRKDPAIAKVLGPGSCGYVGDGPVGSGTFVWPTALHARSGFDYTPETNHYGVDLAGNLGSAIYAVDSGVVVYAGWNDWGYGNMVVVDHGGGWQSLYAHLSALNVVCGSAVFQGTVIGAMGNTGNSSGPHLHFELRLGSTRVNPWSVLPR
jgi:murein DD-endopeptidase MepM/ murein hydrolase activator NlpD